MNVTMSISITGIMTSIRSITISIVSNSIIVMITNSPITMISISSSN